VYPVTGVPPSNIPAAVIAGTSRLDLMKQYFYCGFTYPEIVLLLINNIKISLLNRILKVTTYDVVLDIHLNIMLEITFPMKFGQAVSALVSVICGHGW